MNIAIKLLILSAGLTPEICLAAPVQDIELIDGSIVRAEVISLRNETYTLRSDSLGDLQIPATKIKSISASGHSISDKNSAAASAVNIDSIRKSIVKNPNAMAKIEALQNDPLVKNILNDEATMRALNAGDLNTLMNDPKIKALMRHSTIHDLTHSSGLQ